MLLVTTRGDGGDHGCLCLDQAADRSDATGIDCLGRESLARNRWPTRRSDGWPRPAGVSSACPCEVSATCRKTAPCRSAPRGANRSCWQCQHVRPACTCGKWPAPWEVSVRWQPARREQDRSNRNKENDAGRIRHRTASCMHVARQSDRKQRLNLSPGASDIEGQALLVDALLNWSDQVKFDGSPETHAWLVNTLEFSASWR